MAVDADPPPFPTSSLQSATQILAAAAATAVAVSSSNSASTDPVPNLDLGRTIPRKACFARIQTGLASIDDLLSASTSRLPTEPGLATGNVLEITAPTGAGKTCLAAQIAAQWAKAAGQLDWDEDDVEPVVYVINTEGGLTPEKLAEAIHHVNSTSDSPARPSSCMRTMKRIKYLRCTSMIELICLLKILSSTEWQFDISQHPFPAFVQSPEQCLIVIDSISEFMRASCITSNQQKQRSASLRILREFGQAIRRLGSSAVVTNGMAMKLHKDATSSTGKKAAMVPQVNRVVDTQHEEGYLAGLRRQQSGGSSDGEELKKWESWLGVETLRLALRWAEPSSDVRLAYMLPLGGGTSRQSNSGFVRLKMSSQGYLQPANRPR